MQNKKIPSKIALSADDPFMEYLGFIYNSGIDYMQHAETMSDDIELYQDKLNDYMVKNKISFMFDDEK